MSFRLYPVAQHWWSLADYGAVLDITRRLQPKTVLEFGPGSSTLSLIEGGAGHIDCCEDDPKWFDVYRRRLQSAYPGAVEMIAYDWADPVAIPAVDGKLYDMALIDGPRTTENRVAVLDYCLQRCAAVLIPLEESPDRHGLGYLRPHVMAAATSYGRTVDLIESGPLSGTFALLT